MAQHRISEQKLNSILGSIQTIDRSKRNDITHAFHKLFDEFNINLEQLESSLHIARTTIESTFEGMAAFDLDGKLIEYNQRFLNMWGLELTHSNPLNDSDIYRILKSYLNNPENFQLQLDQHTNGDIHTVNTFFLNDGRHIEISGFLNDQFGIIWTCHDITTQKHHEQQLRYQTEYDALTGLPNKIIFQERLQEAIKETSDKRTVRFAIAAVNIDHIKKINDTAGHDYGDQVIKTVSHRLVNCLRSKDTVCRTNGDEFLIILPDILAHAQLTELANRILQNINQPMFIEKNEFHTSASIGFSVFPSDSTDANSLTKYALIALGKAKEDGRNSYHFFTEYLERYTLHRVNIENQLHQAVAKDEFDIHYQPIYDAQNRYIKSFEALIRWESASQGYISPACFIPIAEDTDLIHKITSFVINRSFQQLSAWHQQGHNHLKMSINLSAKQFNSEQIVDEIHNAALQYELECQQVILEITESMILKNMEMTVTILDRLRKLGFQIALDDFGAGYSSLSYLKQLPVDIIKLDRSFCQDLPNNELDITLARNIISLINDLGLQLVAEGVEHKPSLNFLIENRCYLIQGYYYSKPVNAEEATLLIENGISTPTQ